MPNELISFRLTSTEIAALGVFKLDGESNSLTVKRLLLNVINGHQPQSSGNLSPVSGSHQNLVVESSADDSVDIDDLADKVADRLMPRIETKLGQGYLSALLEGAVEACSLPAAIGKVELGCVAEEVDAGKKTQAKFKQELGKRFLDVEGLTDALNKSVSALRQEVFSLNSRITQIEVSQNQNFTTCTTSPENNQPEKVVTSFEPNTEEQEKQPSQETSAQLTDENVEADVAPTSDDDARRESLEGFEAQLRVLGVLPPSDASVDEPSQSIKNFLGWIDKFVQYKQSHQRKVFSIEQILSEVSNYFGEHCESNTEVWEYINLFRETIQSQEQLLKKYGCKVRVQKGKAKYDFSGWTTPDFLMEQSE